MEGKVMGWDSEPPFVLILLILILIVYIEVGGLSALVVNIDTI